jgi:uncharacterized protein YbdZ (MbtH family)
MASPIYEIRPAYSQPIASGYEPLAPRSRQDTPSTNTARDPNLGSANHDMSWLSALAYPNDAPIHGLADIPLDYYQRILGVAPPPLAPDHTRQHITLLATQTSAVATTTCLDYLHSHTRTMRPSTASPICPSACSQRVLGVARSPLALAETRQHITLLATQTSAVATTTCLDYLHSHTRTMRPSTASPICPYASSQRVLGVARSPLALAETRQHTLLATQTSTAATTTCLDYLHSHIPERRVHPRPHRYTSSLIPTDIGCDQGRERGHRPKKRFSSPVFCSGRYFICLFVFLLY